MKKEQKQITAALEQDFCKLIVILAARSGKNKVTWKELEQETGFTRQALSKKEAIVKAYKEANQSSNILEDIGRRAEETQSKLDKINYSTFSKCNSLKEISIPSTVTAIDDFAFSLLCHYQLRHKFLECIERDYENGCFGNGETERLLIVLLEHEIERLRLSA